MGIRVGDLEKAEDLEDTRPEQAIALYAVVASAEADTEEELKAKEKAIYRLGEMYKSAGRAADLGGLVRSSQVFLSRLSKAKAARMTRTLLDAYLATAKPTEAVALVSECVEWCKAEKRTYLRQALEARLVALHVDACRPTEALAVSGPLLRELKKLDDKLLLVEVNLMESRAYLILKNVLKARASLTTARTQANAIYCPPLLQAALDLQGGIIHAEESDFKTAYSYFYEAFEGYDGQGHPTAIKALKYMLLTKILLSTPEEVKSIVSGKLALKYEGRELEAMGAIAKAAEDRDLREFQAARKKYEAELGDPAIQTHANALYDRMLEANMLRLVEPFSCVEIAHVAKLIDLPQDVVERKLSQMILDKKVAGILDQGDGTLILRDEPKPDATYESALEAMTHMGLVVDTLYRKAHKLT